MSGLPAALLVMTALCGVIWLDWCVLPPLGDRCARRRYARRQAALIEKAQQQKADFDAYTDAALAVCQEREPTPEMVTDLIAEAQRLADRRSNNT